MSLSGALTAANPRLTGISTLVGSKDLWPSLVESIDLVCLDCVLIGVPMSPFSPFLRVKEIK